MGLSVGVVAEQGRVLAARLPQGHPWSFTEQLATLAMHMGAEAQERAVLLANGGDVLIADGTTATPAVWHLCAVGNRPGRLRPHPVAGPRSGMGGRRRPGRSVRT